VSAGFEAAGATGQKQATPPVFETRDIRFRYEDAKRPAVDGVSLQVEPGSLYAVIGPNGSGKSTLVKLLLGTLRPAAGVVRFSGRLLSDWNRRALARRIGVVPQGEELAFPLTVREMVAMGRYPHLGLLGRPGPLDSAAIEAAMQKCDVVDLADRPISRLSGGERQRARIARALAQQPGTLVLDEPTVSLDIRHEMSIFELLAALTAEDGVTVVLVTHNLNLAARYADRLLLLDGGVPVAEGAPSAVLSKETIERVYRWSVLVSGHPGPGPDAGAPQITPLAGELPRRS
jgi:iron complex transport system ATP-binding protein